jgi:hypothetical protein
MILGERLKAIREKKNLSQGDIEAKNGLMRCYISRVENGIRCRLLKLWKKRHEHWTFRCISCSMKVAMPRRWLRPNPDTALRVAKMPSDCLG